MTTKGLSAVLFACIAVCITCGWPALAQDQGTQEVDAEPSKVNREQPITVPDPDAAKAAPGGDGQFKFGGALRFRYDWRFNDVSLGGFPKASEHFDFDTLALKATYDSSTIFGAAQYRFYGGSSIFGPRNGYQGYPGEVNFPMWAYVGYKLTPDDSLTFGLNQTPFGLTPYFGTSFLETLGFFMGLEEVYNFGLKYAHTESDFNYQVGFYPGDNPNAIGLSRDSARYSTNIVLADPTLAGGTNNSERNMAIGRIEYFPIKNDLTSLAFGASIWHSEIYNVDTRRSGTKQLESVHVQATAGPWGFKGIYVRQDISPKNPGQNDFLSVGGYDASYNMAGHGNFMSAEVTYKAPDPVGPFTVVPFAGYSRYFKDAAGFKDSDQITIGGVWTLIADPSLIIYTEYHVGRNNPYIGAGQFAQGLAVGGDDRWKSRFIMNIGYYF